jgi:hypothetical protein
MEQLCDIVFENVVCCHSENNALHRLKNVTFVKDVLKILKPPKTYLHL